jgi:hypothetical protein
MDFSRTGHTLVTPVASKCIIPSSGRHRTEGAEQRPWAAASLGRVDGRRGVGDEGKWHGFGMQGVVLASGGGVVDAGPRVGFGQARVRGERPGVVRRRWRGRRRWGAG